MDRRILAIGLFFLSLLGLLLIPPEKSKISELSQFGRLYKVCGSLVPVKNLRSGCIYYLYDNSGRIKAVSFFGECVSGYTCVYGRLEEYRGEKELVILSYT